jgi:hypothetical protein
MGANVRRIFKIRDSCAGIFEEDVHGYFLKHHHCGPGAGFSEKCAVVS